MPSFALMQRGTGGDRVGIKRKLALPLITVGHLEETDALLIFLLKVGLLLQPQIFLNSKGDEE